MRNVHLEKTSYNTTVTLKQPRCLAQGHNSIEFLGFSCCNLFLCLCLCCICWYASCYRCSMMQNHVFGTILLFSLLEKKILNAPLNDWFDN